MLLALSPQDTLLGAATDAAPKQSFGGIAILIV